MYTFLDDQPLGESGWSDSCKIPERAWQSWAEFDKAGQIKIGLLCNEKFIIEAVL